MKRILRSAAIKAILAPTDLSPGSLSGVIKAAALAHRFQANLIPDDGGPEAAGDC